MARILIVDDEPGYCEMLGQILSANGHEIQATTNGRSAIEEGRRMVPDLLVTDWSLTDEWQGLQVAERLREDNPDLRVILITGYLVPDLHEQARAVGIEHFLQKPFEIGDLLASVRAALGR